jgi:hypothetical protein
MNNDPFKAGAHVQLAATVMDGRGEKLLVVKNFKEAQL